VVPSTVKLSPDGDVVTVMLVPNWKLAVTEPAAFMVTDVVAALALATCTPWLVQPAN
jgi:hypothetical protein